jgi:hypothetical protein
MNRRWELWRAATGESDPWQFMLWVSARWQEWDRQRGSRDLWPHRAPEDHAAFDAWLEEAAAAALLRAAPVTQAEPG